MPDYEQQRSPERGRREHDVELGVCVNENRFDSIENSQSSNGGWIRAVAGMIVLVVLPFGTWATSAILTDLVGLRAMMSRVEIAAEGERRDYVNLERRVTNIERRHDDFDAAKRAR
ncbi:hypothetical protein UFOVP1419_34 [uncultured Caudovirales phage]|uniref:Uncharacterized protein n=1 Tax=uncultured Caudovirales phage TaxID=2100421 RepID=A0A6J5SDE0_9CAUD|nr:hypothetical protein UFOVP1419_34 [uncultured Caudovirales phage]